MEWEVGTVVVIMLILRVAAEESHETDEFD